MKRPTVSPTTFAACPFCFAVIASPFLPWHQDVCPSASKSVGVQSCSPAHLAPPTPIKTASGRDSSCAETMDIPQNPDSCSPADGLESGPKFQVQDLVDAAPMEEDVQQAQSCNTQDGSELDVQNLKSVMLTLQRDYAELEMKYKDLLNKEEDLQRQLMQSKAAEKKALSVVESLRAELHNKEAVCRRVEVTGVEGASQHLDCGGTVDVDTASVSFGNWRNGSSLDRSFETNPSASLVEKVNDIDPKIGHLSNFVFHTSGNSNRAFSSILGVSSKPLDTPIGIDEMRTNDASNTAFDSKYETEADHSSTLAHIPKSCSAVVSDVEKHYEQPRHMMLQKPLTDGEASESSSVLPSVSAEIEVVSNISITDGTRERGAVSGLCCADRLADEKVGDDNASMENSFLPHCEHGTRLAKHYVEQVMMLQKPLIDGEVPESSSILPSVSAEIEVVSNISITDGTRERGAVSGLCHTDRLADEKVGDDNASMENSFLPDCEHGTRREKQYVEQVMDLSTEEICGLVLPPINTCNQLQVSLSSGSGEADCMIKNTNSGACPHDTISDFKSVCRQYVDTNMLRDKGLHASMNEVIPECQVQLHLENNFERTVSTGIQRSSGLPLPEVHVDSHSCGNLSSASDETDFVFMKAKSGVRYNAIMSDSESESCHQQGATVVKGCMKFQGDQENDLSMVSCGGADRQSDHLNTTNNPETPAVDSMGAGGEAQDQRERDSTARQRRRRLIKLSSYNDPETPAVDSMGARGEGQDQRERDSTAMQRRRRLIKLSSHNAMNNNETKSSLNEERTANKSTEGSLDKESSDCQSVSESGKFTDKTNSSESGPSVVWNLCLKRKGPSRIRKRLFDDLSDTESNRRCSKKFTVLHTEYSSAQEDSDEVDESDEGNSLDGFIVDSEESSKIPDEGDLSTTTGDSESVDSDQARFDVRKILQQRRKNYDWDFQTDMQAVLDEDPELCLRAVCALYRQQTEEEQRGRGSLYLNNRGFDKIHAEKGSLLAEFLTDGVPSGPMKKSVKDLNRHDAKGVDFCRKLAFHHSKQLFEIYKNGEDPHFPYH